MIAVGHDTRTGPFNPYGAWISRGLGMALHGSWRTVDKIVSGLPREMWPQKLDYVFEATRVAPSFHNRQPWRFEVQDDGNARSSRRNDLAKGKQPSGKPEGCRSR